MQLSQRVYMNVIIRDGIREGSYFLSHSPPQPVGEDSVHIRDSTEKTRLVMMYITLLQAVNVPLFSSYFPIGEGNYYVAHILVPSCVLVVG